MCTYRFYDKDTGEYYCELLDKPCTEANLTICPLLAE